MRILFWGNQDNNSYRLCKWIRAMGYDAHLYMMKYTNNARSYPECIDRELEHNYPEWIHLYNNRSNLRLIFIPKIVIDFVNENFDIIVASGSRAVCTVYKFSLPAIICSVGSDVNEYPFIKKWQLLNPGKIILAYLLRKGIKKAEKVLTCFIPSIKALKKLGHQQKTVCWGYPEDLNYNASLFDKELLEELTKRYSKYSAVFLWLSRVSYKKKWSPNYKGTDKFLNALKNIVRSKNRNFRIIIGTHGPDIEDFMVEINNSLLKDMVDYVPHLPYWKLLTYLKIPNAIIFDEIVHCHGELSGIAREAITIGGIVAKSFNLDLNKKGYRIENSNISPIMNITNTSETYEVIQQVLKWTKDDWNSRHKEVIYWGKKYLNYPRQVSILIQLMEDILN